MALIMDRAYCSALILGYERMVAWSDLLDQINVFPVADADTGRNLKISLAPLRRLNERPAGVPHQILKAATGNAGNIAAAFFHELLRVDGGAALADAIHLGCDRLAGQWPIQSPVPCSPSSKSCHGQSRRAGSALQSGAWK